MKAVIESGGTDLVAPYKHLVPIVEVLLRDGNELAGASMFYQDRDGWRCDLKKPINFDLIRNRFSIPQSILLSESHDAVLCQNTWIEIKGNVQLDQVR